ncbi:MAG: tetratricopeptide repeat protein, partial [bacterium]
FPLQFSKYILWIFLFSIPFFLKRKILSLFFLLIFIVNSLHSIRYTIVNICDYYIPSFILTSIIMGIGLSFIIKTIPYLKFLFPFLILIPIYSNHFQNNKSRLFFSYNHGMNILRPLKKEAIIFSYGDYTTFPVWYLKYVEKRREDVSSPLIWIFLACDWHIEAIKKKHPNITFSFDPISYKELKYYNLRELINERLNKIIASNFDRFPIYAGHGVRQEKGLGDNFLFLPDGLFFRLLPKDEKTLGEELEKTQIVFLFQEKGFKDRVASNIWSNYSLIYNEMGNLYRKKDINQAISFYKKALDIESSYAPSRLNLALSYLDKNEYDKAKENLEIILKENKNFEPALVHYGLGIVYQNKKDFKMAISEYTQALKIDPENAPIKQMLENVKKILDKN